MVPASENLSVTIGELVGKPLGYHSVFQKGRSMLSRAATALLFSCLLSLAAHAASQDAARSREILQQGIALDGQGKWQEALAKYREAAEADTTASLPLSSAANLFLRLSTVVIPTQKQELRKNAEGLARAALEKWPQDPVANEVLRGLEDGPAGTLHEPNQAAAAVFTEAENAFSQRKWALALEKYEAAMAADPQLSNAWLGAGDVYYMQNQWPQAESLFRKATAIEPRNSPAWRYLADALAQQGKLEDAQLALLSAIAAQPSQRPNWDKLSGLYRATGRTAPEPLGLKTLARLQTADGGKTLEISPAMLGVKDNADALFWWAKAATEIQLRAGQPALSPFKVELESWRAGIAAVEAQAPLAFKDAALRKMQEIHRANQLDAAILLLAYREAFRPDLEQWLANHPQRIREFIATWNLRP